MIFGKSAACSSRRNVGDRPKTMCRQKLRNEVPEAGKPALSCHPWLLSPHPLPHIRACDVPRQTAMKCDLDHCDRISLARRTNRLLDCGTRADRSTTVRTLSEYSGCMLCVGRPSVRRTVLDARSEQWRDRHGLSVRPFGLDHLCPRRYIR